MPAQQDRGDQKVCEKRIDYDQRGLVLRLNFSVRVRETKAVPVPTFRPASDGTPSADARTLNRGVSVRVRERAHVMSPVECNSLLLFDCINSTLSLPPGRLSCRSRILVMTKQIFLEMNKNFANPLPNGTGRIEILVFPSSSQATM